MSLNSTAQGPVGPSGSFEERRNVSTVFTSLAVIVYKLLTVEPDNVEADNVPLPDTMLHNPVLELPPNVPVRLIGLDNNQAVV
jgi:hypothetical protein